jgi:predicted Rossmann fold nucleotide-binding protein DprA/Smf involved in DNA uptake
MGKAFNPSIALSETARVWYALGDGTKSIDELAEKLGLATPSPARSLLMLEMEKGVGKLPANRYERR